MSKPKLVNYNARILYNPKSKQFTLGFIDRLFKTGSCQTWKSASKTDTTRIKNLIEK